MPSTQPDHHKLPIDPDIAAENRKPRPRHLVLVFIGGTVGTAARQAITMSFRPVNDIPYATFGINLAGAFLLGVLLSALARHGADGNVRLLLGTGTLGGFTTYSALAVDTTTLISRSPGDGVAYAVATVILGGVATWAGIALASATGRSATGGSQ